MEVGNSVDDDWYDPEGSGKVSFDSQAGVAGRAAC